MKQGLWMKYYREFEAYRKANVRRCNQMRHWIAKVDGIYFEKNQMKPQRLALTWLKTK